MNEQKYVNPEINPSPAPVENHAKGLALASFLCGLGSVVCCMGVPASVVGLALGHVAKKKGNRSGLRKAGTVFCIAGIVFHVLLMVFAATVMPDMLDEIYSQGAAAYHFGNAIDMCEMMKVIPEGVVAMGNIDPAGQFKNGTPESIANETKSLLEKCSCYDNFVISSGCDIPPAANWDNIMAYYKTIEEFYSKK